MLTLVFVRNPFNLDDREIRKVEYVAASNLHGYVNLIGIDDYVVSVNGAIIDEPTGYYPQDGDYIAVCPVVGKGGGKKNPFAIIAGIALSVITMGVGSVASGGAFAGSGALAMSSWTFGGYLAAAATMYLGGMMMNHLFPPPSIDYGNQSYSPTYSWNDQKVMQNQGNPVQMTYGKVLDRGQLLAQHITSDGDKQYLNLLICAGEGPLDSIEDIRINNNPIANYTGVTVETRLGTNNQEPVTIPGLLDTYSDQQLGFELQDNAWSTQLTEGNGGSGLEIEVDFPSGLYHLQDNGNLAAATVTIAVEYRQAGGAWNAWGQYSISASQNTAVRRIFRLDNLTPAQYEVRAKVVSRSAAVGSSRDSVRVYWSRLSQIIYDRFVRPNKALVAIKALATDQLSGQQPDVTYIKKRLTVWVWNPNTNQYEAKSARNPAWAAYDMCHLGRRLQDVHTGAWVFDPLGVPKELMLWQRFKNWADMCDAKNLHVDLNIDKASDLENALKEIESCGRGKVMRAGTKFSCIFDAPSQPVQMFTMGNIYKDTFVEEFLDIKDRANAIEVTFNNEAKNYERDTFTVYADDYDEADAVDNPTQITFNGITNYEAAYREAKYRMYLNNLLQRTCTFEVDVDAIACQAGDVVLVSHDVPQWGQSGRLANATANELTLNEPVTMKAGKTYGVYVRLQDDTIIRKTVQTPAVDTETHVITVTSPFDVVPQQDDIYAFGEVSIEAKPFRLIFATRSQKLRRKLVMLEYNENVYNENYEIPPIQYAPEIDLPKAVTNLDVAQATWRTPDGTTLSQLNVSWKYPTGSTADKYVVSISRDLKQWYGTQSVYSTSATISVNPNETYFVRVASQKGLVLSGWVVSNAVTTGRDSIPPDVVSLTVEKTSDGKKRFTWAYEYPNPNDVAGFRIKYNVGSSRFWANAIPLHGEGLINASPFETTQLAKGTYTVMIKAVDYAGNESENAAFAVVGVGDDIVDNVLETIDFKELGWPGTKTNCSVQDGIIVGNGTGGLMWNADSNTPMWTSDDAYFWVSTYDAMSYQESFTLLTGGKLNIQFSTTGNVQVFYRALYPLPMWTGDDQPMWTDDAALMWIPGAWTPYAGKVDVSAGDYEVRIDIGGGVVQPTISEFKVIVDVADIYETFNDIIIPATGLRLPITNSYHRIKHVNLTLQDTGGNAATVKLVDKDVTGPMVMVYSDALQPTTGVVDAEIQGY